MNQYQNPWDILIKKDFNTYLKEGEVDPRAADNILIAWPPILRLITQRYPYPKGIKILDFGCGSGGFCNKLNQLGFGVTGIDSSNEMINTAKRNSSQIIGYVLGDETLVSSLGLFDVIVSIMTFPFIKDINRTLNLLLKSLKPNGLLVFSDFNQEWVKACLKTVVSFADFDSKEDPKTGWKTFGEIKIPVYIRTSEDYATLTKQNGLTKIFEAYPPFTKEFIQKYPDARPKQVSEYLILGYLNK